MAEPPVQVNFPVRAVTESLEALRREFRTGRLGQQIGQFNGDGTRRFRDWLKDIERVGQAVGANDEIFRLLCLESLKGPALDHFSRLLQIQPPLGWLEIVAALQQRYVDEADTQVALQKLIRLRQRQGESTLVFLERIRSLADEAYMGQNMAQPHIQTAMTGALINGIMDDGIARRLIRERPGNFEVAAQTALREQQTAKQFAIRRGQDPEPMDVSQVMNHPAVARLEAKVANLESELETRTRTEPVYTTEQKLDFLNAKIEQLESSQKQQSSRNQQTGYQNNQNRYPSKQARYSNKQGDYRQPSNQNRAQTTKYEWTPDGKVICAYCRIVGHVRRDCRKRKRVESPPPQKQGNW